MGWNACSSCHGKPGISMHKYLVLGAVLSGNIYFVDVKTDPRQPRLFKVIAGSGIAAKAGLGLTHTSHCAPEEIIASFMEGPRRTASPATRTASWPSIRSLWRLRAAGRPRAILRSSGTTSGTPPQRHGVHGMGRTDGVRGRLKPRRRLRGQVRPPPLHLELGKRAIAQTLDLCAGAIPLEVRFLHDPDAAEGFVGCVLSSTMVRFFKKQDGKWDKGPAAARRGLGPAEHARPHHGLRHQPRRLLPLLEPVAARRHSDVRHLGTQEPSTGRAGER